MTISNTGIAFLKKWEGLRLQVYKDAGGFDTIGHGHLVQPGENFTGGITPAQADALFRKDLIRFEATVNSSIKVPLKQHQFDALVAYAFNIGASAFAKGTLVKYINEDRSAAVIRLWWVSHYITSNGIFVQGLVNRRMAEADLYFNKSLKEYIPTNISFILLCFFVLIILFKFIVP